MKFPISAALFAAALTVSFAIGSAPTTLAQSAPIPGPSPSPKSPLSGGLLDESAEDMNRAEHPTAEDAARSLVERARSFAYQALEEMPNLVSTQHVTRFEKRPTLAAAVRLNEARMTIQVREDTHKEEVSFSLFKSSDVTLATPQNTPAEIQYAYENSTGMRQLDTYSNALGFPFVGGGELRPDPSVVDPNISAFFFDSGSTRFISIPIEGSVDQFEQLSGRGRVFIRKSDARILKIEMEGYGMSASQVNKYVGYAVEFGEVTIAGAQRKFWLPKVAASGLGASKNEHLRNRIEFELYQLYASEVKILDN